MNITDSTNRIPSLLTPEIHLSRIKARVSIPRICFLGFFPGIYSIIKRKHDSRTIKIPGSDFGYILFEYKSLPLAFRYPGIGSPSSVLCLEQSAFLGADTFLTFGSAGALEADIHYRDLIIPPYAISDEGTSRHYGMEGNRAPSDHFIYRKIVGYFQNQRLSLHAGPCWTTDAPYRETLDKINAHRKLGCIAVEMECSALFAASAFLKKRLGSFLVAVDGFAEGRWISRLRPGQNNNIDPKNLFGFACEIALSLSRRS